MNRLWLWGIPKIRARDLGFRFTTVRCQDQDSIKIIRLKLNYHNIEKEKNGIKNSLEPVIDAYTCAQRPNIMPVTGWDEQAVTWKEQHFFVVTIHSQWMFFEVFPFTI